MADAQPGSGAQLPELSDWGGAPTHCAPLQITEIANKDSQLMHGAVYNTLAAQPLISIIF